jgi:outer membrane lipoprotein-sorting protein
VNRKSVLKKTVLSAIVAQLFCTFAVAETNGPNPSALIDKMRQTYANAKSYRDTGIVETCVSQGAGSQTLTKPFGIVFLKPSSLRVEWATSFGGIRDPYVLYSTSDGTCTYNERINQLQKEESLEHAIRRWTGVSGGAVRSVPCMLLNTTNQTEFGDLSDLKYMGIESIGDAQCYRIWATRRKQPVNLWIGVNDYLLHKVSVDTPFGKVIEIHLGIELDKPIGGTTLFTPPDNAEVVERFQLGKGIKKSGESPSSKDTGP